MTAGKSIAVMPGRNAIDKPARERSVFRRFAASLGDYILPASIRSRRPPEPDIKCRTGDGTQRAFELVEIVDPSIRRGRADSGELRRVLREEWEKSAARSTRAHLSNALVDVVFRNDATAAEKRRAVSPICRFLNSDAAGARGKLELEDWAERPTAVSWMAILRGGFRGPVFDVADGGAFADPIAEQIAVKLKKRYPTVLPLELLAYYDLQPTPWSMAGLRPVRELLTRELKRSSFSRVWVFDLARAKVLLVRPTRRTEVEHGRSIRH